MRTGLVYGAIIAILGVIGTGISTTLGVVVFILSLGLLLLAGRSASYRTQMISSGVVSGLMAGIVAAVVGGLISIFTLAHYAVFLQTTTVAGAVVGVVMYAGLGAGLGALGGLMGHSAARKAWAKSVAATMGVSNVPRAAEAIELWRKMRLEPGRKPQGRDPR